MSNSIFKANIYEGEGKNSYFCRKTEIEIAG
jgi:hypothetical protein